MSRIETVLNIHTEQVQDILGQSPSWIVRWGSLSILVVLIVLVSIAAFLKYPTIISGNLKLTTKEQPVKIASKVPGKIERIYADRVSVNKGEKLALIENPLNYVSIDILQNTIAAVYSFLNGQSKEVKFNDETLGYLQLEYNALRKNVVEYQFFKDNEYYSAKIQRLKDQIQHNDNLIKIAKRELALDVIEFKNNEEKFNVDKKLFESQVTSRTDFLKAENEFVKQQQESEGLKRRIEELSLTALEYKRQLEDATFELKQKELDFTESIKQAIKGIESSVFNWKQNYLIQAPIAGKVFVLNNLSEKQHVKDNVPIFIIVPSIQKFVCFVEISAKGFGKIRTGQRVRIKLHNYPSHEFGQLSGKVIQVPEIPIEDENATNGTRYRVLVEVDEKSTTSYNKILQFNAEMAGIGEIVIEDQTLLQRLFNQLRGRIDN
jgi:hypothetical protein